jgi:dihydrofolate synthase/folylpolyglutamate synthase
MALLPPGCPVISVAGTNGKGSSVAMLESIYRAAGYRTVCYSSPHLLRYNERIRVNGLEASDQQLCDAFAAIDSARGEITLSYFEFGTLAALYIIHQQRPDVAILEVGLGGRLDAVNIVDADVALVTAIGIDHVAWLGNDRESIAREKAGIFRSGRPAICADPSPPESLRLSATTVGAEWYAAGADFACHATNTGWSFHGRKQHWNDLPTPALVGKHQLENAAGALAVIENLLERLPLAQNHVRQGLLEVCLAGRAQRLAGPIEILVDVAHNPSGAARLAELLQASRPAGRTWLILGMLEDKDAAGFAAAIGQCVDEWCLATLTSERGLTATTLRQRIGSHAGSTATRQFDSVTEAMKFVQNHASVTDRIVVCGSFATVAEILASQV